MSVRPHSLAESLRKACKRRQSAEVQDHVTAVPNGSSFLFYDNDGGILEVRVTQYKDPIR